MARNYNKIVRDQVPGKLRASGHKVVTRTLYGKDLLKLLRAKLDEELADYDAAADDEHAAGSLASLIEVMMAMAKQHGYSETKVQQLREAETAKYGAFDLGIFVSTID